MNFTVIIVSLALSVCDIALIEFYLRNSFVKKQTTKKIIIFPSILIFFTINSEVLSIYLSYLLLTIILVILLNNYRIDIKKKLKTLAQILVTKILIDNIVVLFLYWIFNISGSIHVSLILTAYSVLIQLLLRYVYYFIIFSYTNYCNDKRISLHYFKFISLVVSIYFSFTTILLNESLFLFPSIGRTFVFIVIVYNFALIMFDRYQRKAEATEKEFIITKQRIEDDKKYLIKTEAAHDEMRAFRHDLTNKLSIISSHIQRDEKDIALKHLEEMGVTIASNKAKIYIGDPSVDSIIDARVDDMLNKGITFEDSYGLICIGRIDSYDLALLFALALDNAIEAVERITEGERRISLDIHTQREFLYINIENTFISKGKNDFTRTSKKTNIESHGFGVKKMKSLVNKYDGLMDYHFNGNSVMLKIVLNNNYIKENV